MSCLSFWKSTAGPEVLGGFFSFGLVNFRLAHELGSMRSGGKALIRGAHAQSHAVCFTAYEYTPYAPQGCAPTIGCAAFSRTVLQLNYTLGVVFAHLGGVMCVLFCFASRFLSRPREAPRQGGSSNQPTRSPQCAPGIGLDRGRGGMVTTVGSGSCCWYLKNMNSQAWHH